MTFYQKLMHALSIDYIHDGSGILEILLRNPEIELIGHLEKLQFYGEMIFILFPCSLLIVFRQGMICQYFT